MEKDLQQMEFPIIKRFAKLMGAKVENRRLHIPETFGKGFCAGFVFNEYIRMVILNYELTQDIVVENLNREAPRRMILFKFQNLISPAETSRIEKVISPAESQPQQDLSERKTTKESLWQEKPLHENRAKGVPSVLIATSSMNTDAFIPIDTHPAAINIEVDADYLSNLFPSCKRSPILKSLLENTQPLLFEQMIYPSLQKIVDGIMNERVDETFELFFLRIKAEELVCRLLMELEKREGKHLYPLNVEDIQTLYLVKEQMLQHLEIPPVFSELATCAHMSPSKLKRLFRQIFGNSIFSYYQEFRMKEAARLLKEEKLSVSDVGYRLGFTNLSHFSKVFKEHIGMKPKQYSRS